MKKMSNVVRYLLAVTFALASIGCSTTSPPSQNNNQEEGFLMQNESIKTSLKKLSGKYDVVYVLDGRDINLKDSNYRVATLNDLKKYVRQTTNYLLATTVPTYGKNEVYKLALATKDKVDYKRGTVYKNPNLVGVRLDKPMTIKRFYRELGMTTGLRYLVKGNGSIPMQENIIVKSTHQLNGYLKKHTNLLVVSKRDGDYVNVKVKYKK